MYWNSWHAIVFMILMINHGHAQSVDELANHLEQFFSSNRTANLSFTAVRHEISQDNNDWEFKAKGKGSFVWKQGVGGRKRESWIGKERGGRYGYLAETVSWQKNYTLNVLVNRVSVQESEYSPNTPIGNNYSTDPSDISVQRRAIKGNVFPFRESLPLLFGTLFGETEPRLTEILKNAQQPQITSMTFLDLPCELIEFQHPSGNFSIVYCPSLNFAPLQIKIVKATGVDSEESNSPHQTTTRIFEYSSFVGVNQPFKYQASSVVSNVGHREEGQRIGSRMRFTYTSVGHDLENVDLELAYSIPEDHPVLLSDEPQIKAYWKRDEVRLNYARDFIDQLDELEQYSSRNRSAKFHSIPYYFAAAFLVLMCTAYCNKRLSKIAAVGFLGLVFLVPVQQSAAEQNTKYCGIYSIYGAASLLHGNGVNENLDFESLLSQEFVSNMEGSTVADLKRAGHQLGVNVLAVKGLGASSLRAACDPMVLHIASSGQLVSYRHWLLFLGIQDGKALVVDSESGAREMELSLLLARWDGIALVAYRGDKPVVNYGRVEMMASVKWGLTAIIAIGAGYCICVLVLQSATPLVWIGLSVILLFGFQYFCSDTGLGQNQIANAYIQTAVAKSKFPLVTYDEIHRLSQSPSDALIVDARDEQSCQYGMIPGAINLPISLSAVELTNRLKDTARTQAVVIYCQSSGCAYDEILGVRMIELGFGDIQLYHAGWQGWQDEREKNRSLLNH